MRLYRTLAEQVALDLLRKHRLRLIYKWRHGLPRVVRPQHGDRAKLAFLRKADLVVSSMTAQGNWAL